MWSWLQDNYVFDLDFTNQARVLPLKKYFIEMFVPKAKPDIPYNFKSELPYIELELYSSHDYLKTNGITKTTPKRTYKLSDLIDLRDI